MKPKKVLIITYEFPPVGGSGVQRVTKFASYLSKFGWQPYVLTVEESIEHFSDHSMLESLPKDIHVTRTPSREPGYFRSLRRRAWGRGLLRGTLFPDIHAPWRKEAVLAGEKLIREHQMDAIFSTDPATAHWAGYVLQQRTGLPWVMDIRDLWTLSFTYRPISYLHGVMDERLERKLVSSAAAITSVTEGYTHRLKDRYRRLDPEKLVVIRNGYDENDFQGVQPEKSSRFTLVYSGQLYDFSIRPRPTGWKRFFEPVLSGSGPAEMIRSPRLLLEGIGELVHDNPELAKQLQVIFVGHFPDTYLPLIEEYELQDIVKITGYVEHRQAVKYIVDADVLFLMQAGRGSEVVIPGKLYEYLRTGNAILGIFPEGESPEIIRRTNTGKIIEPDDKTGLKHQLLSWFRCWQQKQPLVQPDWEKIRSFERKLETAQLASLLDRLTSPPQ